MNDDDMGKKLEKMDLPAPGQVRHQQELKIPLLSYRKSSKAGFWLLLPAAVVALTAFVRYDLGLASAIPEAARHFLAAFDDHPVLTYAIPLVAVGLPLLAMALNFLAFCHFAFSDESRELRITIKVRPLNIALFLVSFAVATYFLLPDRLAF